jgi:tetratricopeptide (TPR) repeat protein
MALVYKEIEDEILPPLRRAVLQLKAYEPKLPDEEILALALSAPEELSDKELLYAGTLTDDMDKKLEIYMIHMELYPEDWKGYNNAAWVLLNQWELEEAAPLLEIANDLYPNNPMVLNNLGALAAKLKDYEMANDFYSEASKLGAPEGYNTGMLMIPAGEYGAAISSMNRKCNYNTALAKMLNGDNAGAEGCFNCIEDPNAKVYYMKAVLGSRMDNSEMMFENLTKAISEKEKIKEIARGDREFVKYWSDPNWQAMFE